MTALDLLARWSGHQYFIGHCYTLFPLDITRRVDSCVEFAFSLVAIHEPSLPAVSPLRFSRGATANMKTEMYQQEENRSQPTPLRTDDNPSVVFVILRLLWAQKTSVATKARHLSQGIS
jgi:hypothetical protein